MFQDKILICSDCGGKFVFSADEQQFYAMKNLHSVPRRCKACRDARRNARPDATSRPIAPEILELKFEEVRRFGYDMDLVRGFNYLMVQKALEQRKREYEMNPNAPNRQRDYQYAMEEAAIASMLCTLLESSFQEEYLYRLTSLLQTVSITRNQKSGRG